MTSSLASIRRRVVVAAVAFCALGVHAVAAQSTGPSIVVLVRHAEKASATDPDPSLSDAGRMRADALVAALANSPPSAIVVSARKRTAETAGPLATKLGLTPQVISLDGAPAMHVSAVAAAVRQARGAVLVVGHSNTVPAIIKALGGPSLPDICDASYATLYVLQLARDGQPARLVVGQYGASDPVGAMACAGMTPR
jgi:broad specificity phosphatase PhoE